MKNRPPLQCVGILENLSLFFSRYLLESTAGLGVHREEAIAYYMGFTED